MRRPINDFSRIKEFFVFCERLEQHPFFTSHKSGGTFRSSFNFPQDGLDTAQVNFDEIHLESFLTRMRQVLFPRELFSHEALYRSVINLFGTSEAFEGFYTDFVAAINRRYPASNVQGFLPNGNPIVAGSTLKDLFEKVLYVGAIHSERRLNPTPNVEGMAEAHVAVEKHLMITLAFSTLQFARNVLVFRNHILLLARATGQENLFQELTDFNKRYRQHQEARRGLERA